MHTVKRGRKYKCRVCQEELLLDVLESVIGVMQIEGCSKRQLAKRTGRTRKYVRQVMAGKRDLTLRDVADFSGALGLVARIRLDPERRDE